MLVIGHRGASGYSPENTIESFQKAILMHADGIELDVHLSSDGRVVVIHDESVDRTSSGIGLVQDLSLAQLQSLSLHNRQIIPTLAQIFDLTTELLINVELKGAHTAKPVAKLIETYVNEKHRRYSQFIVSSFNWEALQWIRKYNPEIPIGVLTYTDMPLAIGFAKFLKAESIHPHFHLLTPENIAVCNQENIKIFTWTVNETVDIEQVKKLAPHAIITDFPNRI